MNFENYTIKAQEALQKASQIASENEHQQIEPEHLLKALVIDPDGVVNATIRKYGVPVDLILNKLDEILKKMPRVYGGAAGNAYFGNRLQQIFRDAGSEALALHDDFISTEHMFLSISAEKTGKAAELLGSVGLNKEMILKALREIRGKQRVTDQNPEAKYQALER
ncbi:MAG: Clp protease N-terminal domain-containing protein, partial [Calditrichaceae bacterium]